MSRACSLLANATRATSGYLKAEAETLHWQAVSPLCLDEADDNTRAASQSSQVSCLDNEELVTNQTQT